MIGALAQARLDPGGTRICTFCVLGDDPHDLQNGNLTVSGGNLWFNGNVDIGPNGSARSLPGTVTGDDGESVIDGGNAYVAGDHQWELQKFQGGNGQVGQPRMVDPLAAEVLPFVTQDTPSNQDEPVLAKVPGIYDGYKSTSSSPCVMQPGLYVFTKDFELSGNAGATAGQGSHLLLHLCVWNCAPRMCRR